MRKTCINCKKEKEWIKTSKPRGDGAMVCVDNNNKRWNGNSCPECFRYECKMNGRKKGSVPLSEVQHPSFKKARWAEKLVAEKFRKNGYEVKMTEVNGPDLIVLKESIQYTIEVKSVHKESRNRWRVGKVFEKRKCDDFIAIVFDEKNIIIQTMRHHLSMCNKNGSRSVITLYPNYSPKKRSCHA